MPLRTADFDYALPPDRIAQHPAEPRDAARLLVLRRDHDALEHRVVRDLPELLAPGDLLVVNDTRVRRARLRGTLADTGGAAELLLLELVDGGAWLALGRPHRRLRHGRVIDLDGATARIADRGPDGTLLVVLDPPDAYRTRGEMPLPPYIHERPADPERYQTVYARDEGSAAAPTAGLHFTPELLSRLRSAGVETAACTLHVGLDTFRPVTEDDPEQHRMHSEWYELPEATAAAVTAARARSGRVVAVGTTVVRVLESAGALASGAGRTRLYIRPGYRFRAVDGLLTNFHLPRTTLLMLVSAFAGRERVLEAYAEAVRESYRFYSFGDAMLIL